MPHHHAPSFNDRLRVSSVSTSSYVKFYLFWHSGASALLPFTIPLLLLLLDTWLVAQKQPSRQHPGIQRQWLRLLSHQNTRQKERDDDRLLKHLNNFSWNPIINVARSPQFSVPPVQQRSGSDSSPHNKKCWSLFSHLFSPAIHVDCGTNVLWHSRSTSLSNRFWNETHEHTFGIFELGCGVWDWTWAPVVEKQTGRRGAIVPASIIIAKPPLSPQNRWIVQIRIYTTTDWIICRCQTELCSFYQDTAWLFCAGWLIGALRTGW